MALIECNCAVHVQKEDNNREKRTYSLYINIGGRYPNSNCAENLDLEDLKFLEKELAKSIYLEKNMCNEN